MTTQTRELHKTYQPAAVEPAVLERWLAARAYHAEPNDTGEPYAIVIPPPNVTAALHLGHALNNTLQDILIRYHRMEGRNTMWMPGTDHAGIATQTVVEKRVLQEEGKRRTDFSREDFVAKIQAWKDEYEAFITNQLKRMGCSCDWDRQRFTMDPVCARAVREAFFRLFKDGLIYRGKRLVNWDPVTQTALADDEVEMEEVDGHFYYLRYPLVGEDGSPSADYVVVATTRPETMLGDTAVAVNPNDTQRAHLVGRKVKLPIVNRVVPIVGDDYVVIPDPESDDAKAKYASGFLKVTPAHDPNDYLIGQRHNLPIINVMAPDATISKDHGWPAQDFEQADPFMQMLLGKSREEARQMIVQWFKEQGLLEEVRPYRHSVGHSYRSHVPIEPYLSDQWYVAVRAQIPSLPDEGTLTGTDLPVNSLAGLALRAMAEDQYQFPQGTENLRPRNSQLKEWEGHLRFYPDRYARTFQTWHENIRDWCISRQLWWGHRIPVWRFFDDPKSGSVDGDRLLHVAAVAIRLRQAHPDTVAIQQGKIEPINVKLSNDFADRLKEKLGAEGISVNDDVARKAAAFALRDRSVYVCLRTDNPDIAEKLEAAGFTQDPDVLDTWFSSALWPLSTLGWPRPEDFPEEFPEGDAALRAWNPTNVLCTAREIITLWVSRMVMFNLYLRDCLPFHDVFIHAMIQDGHGQKMSKSLGNGVDPMDIIHSHGADAMRFTLAQMTTQTQDVRMPVDLIDPHTGQTFEPKFITTSAGYKVMAPVQESPADPSKKMVTSYGVASGQVKPSDQTPLARNTSGKFDLGRNFANKLWNAVRFALSNLEGQDSPADEPAAVEASSLSLSDRWILSRLARTIESSSAALRNYEFSGYAQGLYDFFWRDLCDWYIETIKPTVRKSATQRAVLAACVDASLRLLHPVMPFITEELWAHLNRTVSRRGLKGLTLPGSDLLIEAAWPRAERSLVDERAEAQFELVQRVVSAARQVRTQYAVPPRQTVDISAKAPAAIAQRLLEQKELIEVLANVQGREVGPRVDKPADAAVAITGDIELYLHGLVDPAAEKARLLKRAADLEKTIATLRSRLANENYVSKAPAKLVNETREQLSAAERESEAVRQQLATLG